MKLVPDPATSGIFLEPSGVHTDSLIIVYAPSGSNDSLSLGLNSRVSWTHISLNLSEEYVYEDFLGIPGSGVVSLLLKVSTTLEFRSA